MNEKVKELIKEIEDAYAVGAIGYSMYVKLITIARELQV